MTKQDPKEMMELGAWLGRHQAFGMIANRCSAADAECLKQMRDSGKYKELGMTWATFCQERAGISRVSADRLINHLEEFGANYFRLSELMPISRETYRLIAGSVSEEGVEVDGKKIPLTRENRKRVMAAVESLRGKVQPKSSADTLRRRAADFRPMAGPATGLGVMRPLQEARHELGDVFARSWPESAGSARTG